MENRWSPFRDEELSVLWTAVGNQRAYYRGVTSQQLLSDYAVVQVLYVELNREMQRRTDLELENDIEE